ncbi:MAG: manganese efflux pump [Lachnospiraceae bacterium]|nr:manganese efflux pump [Lachnospiraceae bacterium]
MGVIVLLAISLSLDTLGIGMAYAMSGIRIPWSTRLVIAVLNVLLTTGAVFLGTKLGEQLPSVWFSVLGGAVLFFLGCRTLWNALGKNETADYDRDDSHILEPWEGVVLGLTLALDSVSAGIGIRGTSLAVWLFPVLTAFAGVTFLTLGGKIRCNLRHVNGAGGSILIILGLIRLFCGFY